MPRRHHTAALALITACGLTTSVLAQIAAKPDKPIPTATQALIPPSPQEIAAVWANSPKLDGRLVLTSLDLSTPRSKDPLAPNWMVYRGNPVPMPLRPGELVVRLQGKPTQTELLRLLAAHGLDATSALDTTLSGDWIVTLRTPAKDESALHALIKRLTATAPAELLFAAPCFDDPFGHRQRVYPTPDILASFAGDASATATHAAAGLATLTDAAFGSLRGGVSLRASTRDGFAVMALANALSAHPAANFAECDFRSIGRLTTIPNDTFFTSCTHLRDTFAPAVDYRAWRAWNYATGTDVRVLVMDSGSQQNHPDLNQLTGRNFVDAPAGGNGDGSPLGTCDDHGTAVAGVVSARMNNALGVAGVAPDSRTLAARMNLQVSSPACGSGFASFQAAWVVNSIAWGRAQGCRVSNASFSLGAVSNAIDAAYQQAYEAGMIHFASSGNEGIATIAYPSSAAYVNSVGGVNADAGRVYNYGEGLDFTGLAQGVATTDRAGAVGYANGDYANVNGTSFSSPGVSGVAAVIFSARPLMNNAVLEATMRTFASNVGPAGYDTDFGWGIPDAHRSILGQSPPNDQCANARTIDSWNYAHAMETTYATASREEPAENCESGGVGVSNSVFYRFTAPVRGLLSFNTAGSSYDTVLALYDTCGTYTVSTDAYTQPFQIACNDDTGGGVQSAISNYEIFAGETVIVKVSRYGGAPATSVCNLQFAAAFTPLPPSNNTCPTASTLAANTVTVATNTQYASSPTACRADTPATCANSGKPVWYLYRPTADGYATIDTQGSSFDTVLSVYLSCPFQFGIIGGGPPTCFAPTQVGCSDDAPGLGTLSRITGLEVRAGNDYYIRLAGYRNGFNGVASGPALLNVLHTPANFSTPANDNCDQAALIPTDPLPFALEGFDATNATTPAGCGDPPWAAGDNTPMGKSVWWSFTPTSDGVMTVDTIGSSYNTVLSVYDGSAGCLGADCAFPAIIDANDDVDPVNLGGASRVAGLALTAGTPYLIRVSAFESTSAGLMNLNLAFTPFTPEPPANDTCEAAVIIPPDTTTFTADPIDTRGAGGGNACADLMWDCTTGESLMTLAEKSIFFSYTPAATGRIDLDTFGSTYDTELALITELDPCGEFDTENGQCNGLYISACNADAAPETPQAAMTSLIVTQGVPLLIRISAAPGTEGGTAQFTLVFTPDDPPPPVCPADLGVQGGVPGQDGILNNNDFVVFIDFFFSSDPRADIGQQGGLPGGDTLFDNNDFIAFIDQFFAGCP